jgi:hypothetical protein
MPTLVYFLCAITSGACSGLIYRKYKASPTNFLFWMMVGFAGLFLSQFLLVLDFVVFPTQIDLAVPRAIVTLLSLCSMIYGFVWEAE